MNTASNPTVSRSARRGPGRWSTAVSFLSLLLLSVANSAPAGLIRAGAALAGHNAASSSSRAGTAIAPAVRHGWGVTLPGVPANLSALTELTRATGHAPATVMWYVSWSYNSAFPATDATRISQWGATPEITWEPWNPAAGTTQPAYSLPAIAAGHFDQYLRSWAAAIHAWGHPLRLRFAHEMNGTWYPWAAGVNGNTPAAYVAAWTHLRHLFTAAHASNVTWVWSPNVPRPGDDGLRPFYPGDSLVDEIDLDGYNWGTTQTWSSWQSFAGIFTPALTQIARFSRRPLGIGEVGCAETGGSKAAWIRGMWATLEANRQVRDLTWFDFDKETDWRLNSSPAALAAFRAGLPYPAPAPDRTRPAAASSRTSGSRH